MSKQIDVAIRMAEKQAERDASLKMSARMKSSAEDGSALTGLSHLVLSHVTSEQYEKAQEELHGYIKSKDDYPQFQKRVERYETYAVDLMNGIKAKRSFPGLHMLNMSKQQELVERAMEHFNELKEILKKIEAVEREVRLDDIRSTVWVIKAGVYCVFALFVIGILLEISRGVLPSLYIVGDDIFGQIVDFIFNKIGI